VCDEIKSYVQALMNKDRAEQERDLEAEAERSILDRLLKK
jgi:hypothetical protein